LARRHPLTYATVQCKEFLLPPEIRVLHCGILPQTLLLENLVTQRAVSSADKGGWLV